jgi:hypothetical protein
MAGISGINCDGRQEHVACMLERITHRGDAGAAGLPGAPDLEYARQVADALDTEHHQVVVTLDELLGVLPDVIYYLESFDALLVQSTVTSYLVGKRAADYAGSVAMRIPVQLKLQRGSEVTEKWILRRALSDVLPEEVTPNSRPRMASSSVRARYPTVGRSTPRRN